MAHREISTWWRESDVAKGSTGRNVRLWMGWGQNNGQIRLTLVPGQTFRLSQGVLEDDGFWLSDNYLTYDGVHVVLTIVTESADSDGWRYGNAVQTKMGPKTRMYSRSDDDDRRRIGGVWKIDPVPVPELTQCRSLARNYSAAAMWY